MDKTIFVMDPNDLNNYLSSRSYISGYSYSYSDLTLYKKVSSSIHQYDKCTHVLRWISHIRSFIMKDKCPSKEAASKHLITEGKSIKAFFY